MNGIGQHKCRKYLQAIFINASLILSWSVQPIFTVAQEKRDYVIGYSKNLFRGFNINDARVAASLMEAALIKEASRGGKNNTLVIDDPYQLDEFIKNKKLDFLSLTTAEFLEIKDRINVYPYCIPIARDSIYNRIILLVRNDSNINSVADLKGKTISITSDYDENYKFTTLWMKVLFWKNQIKDIRKYIGSIKRSDNPSIIATDVFFKKSDACILLETEFEALKELNPQMGTKLKVLNSSNPLLTELGLYTENALINSDLKNILNITYKFHEFVNGKNLLRLLKVKKLVPYKPEYVFGAEILFQEFVRLKKNNK